MGRPIVSKLVDTITYAASVKAGVDLPRDGVITQIDGLWELVYDTGSAVTDSEDAVYKMLGGISIEGGGGRQFVNLSDIRLLHFLNKMDYRGALHQPAFVDTTSQTDLAVKIPFRVHFGNDPTNPFDLSCGIPAEDYSELKFYANFPAADRGGTGVTTDVQSILRLLVSRVQGLSPEERARIPRPKISETDYTIAATATALGKTFNLPTGSHLRRSLLMLLDNTAAPNELRDDTRITELGLIMTKDGNRHPYETTWHQAKHWTRGIFGGEIAEDDGSTLKTPTPSVYPDIGVVLLDYRLLTLASIFDPWGLNMVGASDGDIQLGVTIATANGTLKRLDDAVDF